MKVLKSVHRHFYNVGLVLILIGLIYVFADHRNEWPNRAIIEFFLLSVTGFCMAARAFYVDRYFKLIDNKVPVDFWTFYNETPFKVLMTLIFSIRPIKQINPKTEIERVRRTANYFTYSTYIFFICLFTYLYFAQH